MLPRALLSTTRERGLSERGNLAIEVPNGIRNDRRQVGSRFAYFFIQTEIFGKIPGTDGQRSEFVDPLGPFNKTKNLVREDFIVDCYPSSLLSEIRPSKPMTLALGERIGRHTGAVRILFHRRIQSFG